MHVFLCVLGLFFVRYLSWKVGDQGITDERMMDELARVRVALVSRSDLKRPELVVEEMTPLQARLFTKLDHRRYIKLIISDSPYKTGPSQTVPSDPIPESQVTNLIKA